MFRENRSAGVVLVVDDDPAVHLLLAESLAQLHLDVQGAADEAEALRIIAETGSRLRLVVIDIALRNGENGWEAFQRIRSQVPAVPGIILTGHYTDSVADYAAQLGFSRVYAKPIRLEPFLTDVQALVQRP